MLTMFVLPNCTTRLELEDLDETQKLEFLAALKERVDRDNASSPPIGPLLNRLFFHAFIKYAPLLTSAGESIWRNIQIADLSAKHGSDIIHNLNKKTDYLLGNLLHYVPR